MEQYTKQYINGEWLEGTGESTLKNYNPYTGDLLYEYRSGSAADVDQAYKAAKKAQPKWEALLPAERRKHLEKLLNVLRDHEQEIRDLLIEEGGSAPSKVDFEVNTSQAIINEGMTFPEHMEGTIIPSNIKDKKNFIIRKPVGVIGVISPWNVPFVLSLRSVIPAIATGNTVVLKPSSDTPASALLIAELFEKAGFPAGVLNVVMGRGSEIGDSITNHPIPAMLSFTGSTEVGKKIGEEAGKMIKEVSLELGGNNAMIVLEDANIEDAVNAAVFGSFFNAGQNCIRINRLVILDGVYDQFKEAYVEAVKKIKVGDPKDNDIFYGPVINETQRDKIIGFVDDTIEAGATVELEGNTDGNVIYPWILGDVTNDMATAANEVFGPVSSLIRAKSVEEAIEITNDTNYGLTGAVFTRDAYRGMQIAQQIESGMVHVNDMPINDEPHVMFGGEKESGLGRFNGRWVADKFTREQWVSVQEKPRF